MVLYLCPAMHLARLLELENNPLLVSNMQSTMQDISSTVEVEVTSMLCYMLFLSGCR